MSWAGSSMRSGRPTMPTRVEAMRRLAARGAEATAALREAAQRPDPEVALRARQLMRVLDQLLFQGVEVHLEAEPAEVAWDEPVSVRVTFRQRGLSAGRVPFALDPTDRAALTPTARQVGDLLDLSEWLQIEGPTGAPVPLRVDDLDDSEAAEAAVGQRLVAGPMSELAPGQTASVVVEAVNRGWPGCRCSIRGGTRCSCATSRPGTTTCWSIGRWAG